MSETKGDITPDDIQIIVAENLSKLREFHGMNQTQMANKIRTYQASYCLSEQAGRELTFNNIYHLAVEFGVNLNWLFGLSDVRHDPATRRKHIENLTKGDKRRRLFNKKRPKTTKLSDGGKSGGNK